MASGAGRRIAWRDARSRGRKESASILTRFSDLGLDRPILDALASHGYEEPTPIQTMAIPHVLAGRDLVGIAATGTGKTAAFALPVLQRLAAAGGVAKRGTCRALVLAPTRELAAQIGDSFRAYARHLRLSVSVIVGGTAYRPQVAALARGVDVLVATPGRLLDHVGQGTIRLDATTFLVLDEADHMLDLGFIPAVRKLAARVGKPRQSLMFSATMPREIRDLANEFLNAPETVSASPAAVPAARVDQRLIHVEASRKSTLLAEILRDPAHDRVLVFTRTKRGADRVVRGLAAARIEAVAIHGNKSHGQRQRALAGFRTGRSPVLVATDIAARGIDVEGVALVVNYDLPHVAETYVHRIGRTGRAGAAGTAISFCGPQERPLLRAIEALIRMPIPAPIEARPAADPRGGRHAPASAGMPAPAPAAKGGTQNKPRKGRAATASPAKGDGRRLEDLPFMRASGNRTGAPAKHQIA